MADSQIYYARGDSSTAGNASLNADNTNTQPVVEIQFSGNSSLDFNDGNPDEDTTVFVNGVEQTFTVQFSGYLPSTNKLADVNGHDLRGEDLIVITTEGGQRLFFLPEAGVDQATMEAFPNGAHPLVSLNLFTDIVICFAGGTMIATPQGERPVETLSAGDLVLNKDGVPVRLLWKARRHIPGADLRSSPALRPVCIPRGAMGRQMPHSDLYLSPQHRVLVSHGRNALHFGYEAVLIPAKFLIGSLAHESCPAEGITYYHLLFEQHEIILSNGLETESYQPSLRALGGMEEDARLDFMAEIPRDWRRKLMFREDAYYSVKSYEAPLVALPQPA